MSRSFSLLSGCLLLVTSLPSIDVAHAQPRQIPEALLPWQDWATWDDQLFDCPPQFNGFDKRICSGPRVSHFPQVKTKRRLILEFAFSAKLGFRFPAAERFGRSTCESTINRFR